MRSSTGVHFIALDHVRALAAFIVFSWHFTHAGNGYPVPLDYVPALFPFVILDEGHTGVALFMTLSGYLFARLLNGKSINYVAFLWNRFLRLGPLLLLVVVIVGFQRYADGQSLANYASTIVLGAVYPLLPNGGWSITVELHYYAILPVLLWLLVKSKLWPIFIVIGAIALRLFIHDERGEIQTLAYWTIVGRIDQFALGMFAYQLRHHIAHRHIIAALVLITFIAGYLLFDLQGGFYQNPSYPSPSLIWVVLPTFEGMAYAILIAWYENSFSHSTSRLSGFVGRIGEYSYSIYLLHFFVVFDAARFVDEHIMNISNFYLACFWSLVFFVLMIVPGYISFRFIESPFLKLRKPYIRES